MKLDFDDKEYLFSNKISPDANERNEILEKLKGKQLESGSVSGKKDGIKVTLVTAVMFAVMLMCFICIIGGMINAALALIGVCFSIGGLLILTDSIDDKIDNSLISSRVFSAPFLAAGIFLIISSMTKPKENLLMMFGGFVFLFGSAIFFSKFIQQYIATHYEPNAEVAGYVWKASDPDAPMPYLLGTPLFEFNLYGELYRAFDPKYMNAIVKEKMGEKYVIRIDGKDPYKIRVIPKASNETGINGLFVLLGSFFGLAGLFLLVYPLFS